MRVAVVGAGLAGLACAQALTAAGVGVALFDKGRGAGGRMSSRRVATPSGEAGFDHGAQYMTARDPGFRAQLEAWRVAGLAQPWPAAGEDAWVGAPTMNAPLKAMGAALAVRWNARVETLAREPQGWRLLGEDLDEGRFDAVLLALPAEQAAVLLGGPAPRLAARASATPSAPCWTVMAAFGERLPVEPDVLRSPGEVAWAARNSSKPGRAGPESWVLQASADWSGRNLERAGEEIAAELLSTFLATHRLDPRPTLALAAHRWRYARSGVAGAGAMWDGEAALGVCGDWLLGPRVECAWLSGRRLAEAVTTRSGAERLP